MLKPYGDDRHTTDIAKVGKPKSPPSLAERMGSADLAAKVGKAITRAETRRVSRMNVDACKFQIND
jgi:hypothetical protein